jgi:hypothetical protein
MLITPGTNSLYSSPTGVRRPYSEGNSLAFEPADQQDLVTLGNHPEPQERSSRLMGAAVGCGIGFTSGGIAFALGAPAWVFAVAGVGGGIIGAIGLDKARS